MNYFNKNNFKKREMDYMTNFKMELIDLSEYDLSYDKQFMTLMVRLLLPYIIFKKPLSSHPSNQGEQLQRHVNIYWVGGSFTQPHTWPTNPRFAGIRFGGRPRAEHRNHESLEIISFEEYVHFIQCIYPKIIQDEITKINEICKQTEKKPQGLSNKIKYLEKIQKINREENGSINKIIYFLWNLDHLVIKTTQERTLTIIPRLYKYDSFG